MAKRKSKKQPLEESGDASDGKYAYRGRTSEVKVCGENELFDKAAVKHARRAICERVGCKNLAPTQVDIDFDNKVFEIQFQDQDKVKNVAGPVEKKIADHYVCPLPSTSGAWYHVKVSTLHPALKGLSVIDIYQSVEAQLREMGIAHIISIDDQLTITRMER